MKRMVIAGVIGMSIASICTLLVSRVSSLLLSNIMSCVLLPGMLAGTQIYPDAVHGTGPWGPRSWILFIWLLNTVFYSFLAYGVAITIYWSRSHIKQVARR